jgi:hypothetical protein
MVTRPPVSVRISFNRLRVSGVYLSPRVSTRFGKT